MATRAFLRYDPNTNFLGSNHDLFLLSKKQDLGARRGQLKTPHGTIETPIFMPVGTVASVKSLGPDDLQSVGTQILVGEHLPPDAATGCGQRRKNGRFARLHELAGAYFDGLRWFSGVFLAMGEPRGKDKAKGSRGPLVKIDDDGVTFSSHLDGRRFRMTPEESMRIQMCLGADIIMAFDQCPPGQSDRETVRTAMRRTSNWLARCQKAMTREESRLFGIVQGGIHDDLRVEHAQEISESTDLLGYAIGGLSVGESKEDMWRICEVTAQHLPREKPRYLMGVGTPKTFWTAFVAA